MKQAIGRRAQPVCPSQRARIAASAAGSISLVLLVLVASASIAQAQAVRYGVVTEQARDVMMATWSDDAHQLERAYCVSRWTVAVARTTRDDAEKDDSIFRVLTIHDAPVRQATPNSVDFDCPDGEPELHVHTPSTCSSDDYRTCMAGGLNAFSCQPSRQDLEKLVRRGDSFAVVQCDRRAFRFYYPFEYEPSTIAGNTAGSRKPRWNRPRVPAPPSRKP